jgi:DNA segregation ATPase FtsK/SpoIIIE, S-DNA-T family
MARRRRRITSVRRRTPSNRRKRARRKATGVEFNISEHISREITGIFFIALAIISFLALNQNAGAVGILFETKILTPLLGLGAFLFPVILLVSGLSLLLTDKIHFSFTRTLGITAFIVSSLGLIHLGAPLDNLFESAPEYGGYVGFVANFILFMLVGTTGTAVILACTALISLMLIFDISIADIFSFISENILNSNNTDNAKQERKKVTGIKDLSDVVLPNENSMHEQAISEYELNIIRGGKEKIETGDNHTREEIIPVKEEKKTQKAETTDEDLISDASKDEIDYSNWEFPPLDLMEKDKDLEALDDDYLVQNAETIQKKLEQFNIQVTMKEVHVGPTVVQYTLKPAANIKLSKITALKNDLALALSAQAIRIEAPIPGKGLVGIEVPAKERTVVRFHNLITSGTYNDLFGHLKLVIGRDVSGTPILTDLATMPHLLVAGQTGSGKSIAINSFLASLLYQQSPENLRMILVDPKQVELSVYNGIPHLLTPVITTPDKALQALKWAVAEMNRRYRELSTHNKRNITEYNLAYEDNRMPYIVIVIDELADLMMAASKEIEATICRIAQMARAVGIHMIVATQRPSVDVITGLIKANIPTRIAFTVATGIDSRTILDGIGAEDLIGKGDMLYLSSNMTKPLRVQGVFIDTKEVTKIIHHIKLNAPEGIQYDDSITDQDHKVSIPGLPAGKGSSVTGDGDSDLERAIQAIKESKKASASYLQRRCSFGYAKAARILDELEEMGLVGPANGAKPRKIFIEERNESPIETH